MAVVLLTARLVIAAVFGGAGAGKLADVEASADAARAFGVPQRLAPMTVLGLALGELAIAGALLVSMLAWWAAIAAVGLLGLFVSVLLRTMIRGEAPDCHCFGRLHSGPVGRGTVLRNVLLIAVALLVVAQGPDHVGSSATSWLTRLSAPAAVALIAGVLLAALAVAAASLVRMLLRRHGRLLERVDQLELALASAGLPAPLDGPGLPLGAQAPAFGLPTIAGGFVSAEDLRGARTVLLFWNPSCSFCQSMSGSLRAWWQQRSPGGTRLLVISRGTVEENRAFAAGDEIALDQTFAVGPRYGAQGTPMAVLVDAEGRIASPLVAGRHAVLDLLGRPEAHRHTELEGAFS